MSASTSSEFRRIVNQVQKGERKRGSEEEMVEANLRLVTPSPRNNTNRGLQFLDLIQEGNIGLMKAVDKSSNTAAAYSSRPTRLVDQAGEFHPPPSPIRRARSAIRST